MTEITATELTTNLDQILDRVALHREELLVVRDHRRIARLVPTPAHQTAQEAMADLYQTVPEPAAAGWVENSRRGTIGTREGTLDELSNPWDS